MVFSPVWLVDWCGIVTWTEIFWPSSRLIALIAAELIDIPVACSHLSQTVEETTSEKKYFRLCLVVTVLQQFEVVRWICTVLILL